MAKNLIFVLILFFIGYGPLYLIATAELRRVIGPRFAISFCLATVAEFILPSAIFFFPVLLVIFVATVRDRMDALCRYVLFVALIPFVGWSARVGSAFITQFYVSDVLGLGVVIAMLLKPDRRARPSRGFSAEDGVILTIFLILWLGIGRFPSASGFARNMVTQGLLLVLPYWVLRRYVRDTREYALLIAAFGASTVLLAVYAVYEVHGSWALFDYVSTHLGETGGISRNANVRGGALRASVTMLTPLNLACYISMGLLALACTRRFYRTQAACLGAVAVVVLGLLAPQSRGNLGSVAFGVLVLCMVWRKWGYVAATVVASLGGGVALLALAKISPRIAAFLNLDQHPVAGAYFDYRQLLLHRGLEEGARHPILGQKLSDVLDQLADIQQGEHIVDLVNTYLTFFLTAGLVGMVPLVILLAHALRTSATGFPRRVDPGFERVRAFCVAGLCLVLVELAFVSFIDRTPYMLVFALVGTRLVGLEKRAVTRRASRDRARVHAMQPAGVLA